MMIDRIDERIRLAKAGKVIQDSIWLDCMKDELRPKEKIKAGKTRLVVAPPLDLMIVWNIYFGGFRAMFMDPDNVGLPTESALGLDPEQIWPDWGIDIKESLAVFGVDYGEFDASQHPQWYKVIGSIINAWYKSGNDWAPVDDVVRNTLLHETAQTTELFRFWYFQTFGSLPSGVPGGFTTILNIMVNKLVSRIAFQRTGLPMGLYPLFIRAIFCGDDNLQWIKSSGKEEIDVKLLQYNRVLLATVASEVGMNVTMPDKSPNLTPFDDIKTATFLKRGFSDAIIPNYFLPTMDPKTIMNLVNWYRPKHNPDQFFTNIDEAVKFAVPHGEKFYNEFAEAMLANETIQIMIETRPNLIPKFYDAFVVHYYEAYTTQQKSASGSNDPRDWLFQF
jgi:hypothetical protein